MYAIVEIAGQQFKVEAGNHIFVHRLEGKQGEYFFVVLKPKFGEDSKKYYIHMIK